VRIGVKTQHALTWYLTRRKQKGFISPWLWLSEEGSRLYKNGIYQAIKQLGKRAGIEGVRCSPHTFRHAFGTMALRNGADIRETQVLLGHSTLNMTLRYVATINTEQAIEGHRGTPERRGFSPVDRMNLK
jgi:integrase/recombinase XerC/integrase/recombinase XerD